MLRRSTILVDRKVHLFSEFEIKYTEDFACIVCHVLAIVPPGTFTDEDHEIIGDIVKTEFEATGRLRQLLKDLSNRAKEGHKGSYSVHYGAVIHSALYPA